MGIKLGVEADFELGPDLALVPRLGFAYEPSPVPSQSGRHNHLDGDRAIVALGVGLRWGPVRLDVAGQLHDIAERTSTKGEGIGEDNPGFPSISGTGHILFGGIELGAEL